MKYAARHAPCGTLVSDDLPDGYPVEEGVGLWCPACRTSFWHVAQDQAAAPEPVGAVPPAAATALKEAPPEAVEAVAASAPQLAPPPGRHGRGPSAWPAIGLIVLTALVALVVVVVLLTRDSGGGDDRATGAGATPQATTAPSAVPTATATLAAPATPVVARRLGAGTVRVRRPDGWTVARSGSRLYVRGAGTRIVVSVAPRRGRSLLRLGADTRTALGGGRRVPIRRVGVGELPAVRVTAHGREATALVLGSERYVIARDAVGGTARRVARSIRISR